jgi:hypothetical protein
MSGCQVLFDLWPIQIDVLHQSMERNSSLSQGSQLVHVANRIQRLAVTGRQSVSLQFYHIIFYPEFNFTVFVFKILFTVVYLLRHSH